MSSHKSIKRVHIKTSSNPSALSQPFTQPESKEKLLSTKSPYFNSSFKSSSLSKLKNKSMSCANSGLASPLQNSSPSTKTPQNSVIKKHFSSILNRKKIFSKASSKKSLLKDKVFENEIKEEESFECEKRKMKKKLNGLIGLIKDSALNYESFEKAREVFKEIIEKDVVFGECLAAVKFVYEEWIKGKVGYVAENSQLKGEVVGLNKRIREFEEEVRGLRESVRKLSVENAKIGKENGIKDRQYRSLQEHLIKISSLDTKSYPPSEEAWKLLQVENKTYIEICECMKVDIKNLKRNENKLLDLVDLLRSKGYPVDSLYHQEIHPKYSKKQSKVKKIDTPSEEDENISTPQPLRKKPSIVPKLTIPNLVPENLSNSSSNETL